MEHNFQFYEYSHNSLSCGHLWFLATNWRKSCYWEAIVWSQGKTKVGPKVDIDYNPSVLREHDRGINPLALALVDCAYTPRVLRYGIKCAYSFWRNLQTVTSGITSSLSHSSSLSVSWGKRLHSQCSPALLQSRQEQMQIFAWDIWLALAEDLKWHQGLCMTPPNVFWLIIGNALINKYKLIMLCLCSFA